MKYFVIGDEDTVLGMGLAGVRGRAVTSPAEAKEAFARALDDPEVGILIITERTAEVIRPEVESAIMERAMPIIVEVPDRNGPIEGKKNLIELIREAIGVGV